jgi:hypothetical protein
LGYEKVTDSKPSERRKSGSALKSPTSLLIVTDAVDFIFHWRIVALAARMRSHTPLRPRLRSCASTSGASSEMMTERSPAARSAGSFCGSSHPLVTAEGLKPRAIAAAIRSVSLGCSSVSPPEKVR